MPQPPIIVAATSGDKLQIRKLLEKDAGLVHTTGQNGNTPLHCAVAKETATNIAVLKILLEFKAESLAENDHGDTPLSVAKAKGHGKMLAVLEEAAAAEEAAEAAKKKAAKEAKLAKKAAPAGGGGAGASSTDSSAGVAESGPTLQYRRTANVGWKPLKKDWDKIVSVRKPLTDTLAGRKIALSFSNKAADAAFAKGLDAALKEAGADCKMITKWPVAGWVKDCVYAADECDFVIVLHSANYEEGHFCIAERFLVKNSNVPHAIFELDGDTSHCEYCATPDVAAALLKETVPLSQQDRVETNTMPSTLTPNTLSKEDKQAYEKLTKVWTPKEGAHDALMLDLEALGDQAIARSVELVKIRQAEAAAVAAAAEVASKMDTKAADAKEVEELKDLFASGHLSKRGGADNVPVS